MKEPIKQYKPAEKLELPQIKKEFPKVFTKVSCPSCAKDVAVGDVNLQNSLAKCDSCDVIFSIEKEVESLKKEETVKQEIFRPEGIDLFFYKGDMEITVEQRIHWVDYCSAMFLPLGLFVATFGYFDQGISIFYLIFFTVITLFSFYRLFTYLKAKSHIDINDRSLTIRHRPKNFKTDRSFHSEDIDQVYIKAAEDGSGYYTLHMIVNGPAGQTHEKLITVKTLSKAKYLEQEIEKYLGIEDRKVPEAQF